MNLFNGRPQWRFIDQSQNIMEQSPLVSFAMDDTLCHVVGQLQSKPVIRTWRHQASVVLGIQDHRLPFLQEGMQLLKEQGYEPIVRNSGGLAVVLDEGILNISLILSEQQEKMSIDTGYEYMLSFIKMLFPEAQGRIEAYEIVGSYCPGTYDLSINGKKFAGISQRRIRQGIAVQIYVCIEGNGAERAAKVRSFYEVSQQNVQTKFTYPSIQPEVMASLSELLSNTLTVEVVVERIEQLLAERVEIEKSIALNEEEHEQFQFYYDRIIERNEKMLYEK
jgi:octanoyl-[GcvH]:protein N-octanoyltransferase